ncbi:hypothetical protein ACISSW_27575 [Escherichia coli]
MTCQKSHHLPFDYSLFPPVLITVTAALIIVCFVVLLLMPQDSAELILTAFPGPSLARHTTDRRLPWGVLFSSPRARPGAGTVAGL